MDNTICQKMNEMTLNPPQSDILEKNEAASYPQSIMEKEQNNDYEDFIEDYYEKKNIEQKSLIQSNNQDTTKERKNNTEKEKEKEPNEKKNAYIICTLPNGEKKEIPLTYLMTKKKIKINWMIKKY